RDEAGGASMAARKGMAGRGRGRPVTISQPAHYSVGSRALFGELQALAEAATARCAPSPPTDQTAAIPGTRPSPPAVCRRGTARCDARAAARRRSGEGAFWIALAGAGCEPGAAVLPAAWPIAGPPGVGRRPV